MKNNILTAVRTTGFSIFLFCGIYLMLVWGAAQFSPGQGLGVQIFDEGKKYHLLVGQGFSQDKYFWPRPSAVAYNASGSGGSNKGPYNAEYLSIVRNRLDTLLAHHPDIRPADIPSDLLTAGGSGIDPHISVQAAKIQTRRIARVRNIPESILVQLIEKNTAPPVGGCLGVEQVHVLQLNIDLDHLSNTLQ